MLRLDLGCGNTPSPEGFTGVDISGPGVDTPNALVHDLTEPWEWCAGS